MARPTFYDEKKEIRKLRITPTGWAGLVVFADFLLISPSELVERVGRGAIAPHDYKQFFESQKIT